MRAEAYELQRKNDRLQNKVSQLEATAENLRTDNEKLQNSAINGDKPESAPLTDVDVEYLIKEKNRLGAEKHKLSRRLFEADQEIAAAKSRLRQIEANLGLTVSDREKSADQLNMSRQIEIELRQSSSELQKNLNLRELELTKIKDQKRKSDTAHKGEIQKLESSLAQKAQQRDEADARIKKLMGELATFKKRLDTSEAENTSLSNKALNDSRILNDRISKLQSEKVDLQNSLDETFKQRNESDGLVSYLKNELAATENRLNAREADYANLSLQLSLEQQNSMIKRQNLHS